VDRALVTTESTRVSSSGREANSRRSGHGKESSCLGVLERRLEGRQYLVGDYSVADVICWPWAFIAKPLGQPLEEFPNVAAWRARIKERPAVQRGVDLGKEFRRSAPPSDEEREILFGQRARSVPPPV